MRTTRTTAMMLAAALIATAIAGCAADEPIGEGDENVEDEEFLGYGELLPGPDYAAITDPAYELEVLENGGPTTAADWDSLAEFEAALDEASSHTWANLPTFVAEEFPGATEAERNAIISDFQDAVATAMLMRDDPYNPECLEIYAENELTGEREWQPVCDSEIGPEFEGLRKKVAEWVFRRATAGREIVKQAAKDVGNWATRQAGNVKRVAGEVAVRVKEGAQVAAQRAWQAATWARQQARSGWNYVKDKYNKAAWYVKFAVDYAVYSAVDWVWEKLFGTTETAETDEAVLELLRNDDDDELGVDALFDM